MSARIVTAGDYGSLVTPDMVRSALNLREDHPSLLSLKHRIAEAATRIEGLTRLVLASSKWEYVLDLEDEQEALEVSGLFAVGADPTISVSDADGTAIIVTATVQGLGDILQVVPDSGTLSGKVTIEVTRGVTADKLPADLRSAVITQVEQLIDEFNNMAEGSILRTCSRYGDAG